MLAATGVDPDRRPRAPPRFLPHLPATAVAQLARPRRVRHRRLRRRAHGARRRRLARGRGRASPSGLRSRASRSPPRPPSIPPILFAQAKARDLWQSPLLPPHMLVQAVLLGAAVLLPFGHAAHDLRWILGGAAARARRCSRSARSRCTHPTAHAHLAMRGADARSLRAVPFWAGLGLAALAVAAPWLGVAAAGPALARRAGCTSTPMCRARRRCRSHEPARPRRPGGGGQAGDARPRRDVLSRSRAASISPPSRRRSAGTTGSPSSRTAASAATRSCRPPASTASRRAACSRTSTARR